MNADYIEHLLSLRKVLSVKDLGTFAISSTPAKLGGSGITPPQRIIDFDDMIWNENDHELEDFIMMRNPSLTREAALKAIVDFAFTVRDQVRRNGSYPIGKLGKLVLGEWGNISFESSAAFQASGNYFGLPKLNILPLQEEIIEGNVVVPLAKKDTSLQLLIVILVPLILVAVGATYLFFNPDAYIRFKEGRLFEPKEISRSESSLNLPDTLQGDSTLKNPTHLEPNNPSETTNKANSKNEQVKPQSPKTDKKPDQKPTQPPTQTSSAVVTSPTNKYYIIVQAVADTEQGKKLVAKLRSSGYPAAKVVSAQGKIRVSLQDYATKNEADIFKNRISSTYQGAWVLNF